MANIPNTSSYQPPQNILAAILQSRKQGAFNDPGVQMQPLQSQAAPLAPIQTPGAQVPMNVNTFLNGVTGNTPPVTPQNAAMAAIPGAVPPTNALASLTGIGNPNMSNQQNVLAMLGKLFGGS